MSVYYDTVRDLQDIFRVLASSASRHQVGFPLAVEDTPDRTKWHQHFLRAPASVLDPDIAPPPPGPHKPSPRPRPGHVSAHPGAPKRAHNDGPHDDGLEEHAARLREEEAHGGPIPERPRVRELGRVDAVHECEVHEAGDAEDADALCERPRAPVRDEPVGEVDDRCAHDEGHAPEGGVPAARPEVREADGGEWVVELRWPARGVGPEGNEDDGDECIGFVYRQRGPHADRDGVHDLLVPRKGRDGVVVEDIPCSSSIDDVAEVYDENESEKMKDTFANEGETVLAVFGCEERMRTKVPMRVLEPRGSAHGEKKVDCPKCARTEGGGERLDLAIGNPPRNGFDEIDKTGLNRAEEPINLEDCDSRLYETHICDMAGGIGEEEESGC